ncbi:MAG: hypothetical protein DMD61_00420 [Gemmatimonadetes bacterium]|nr:MAG: hypothetical protein DMD61_00420 [Gemmatimonadota bacterium]
MRHTFLWVRVHLVWSTYRRQRWIAFAWQERLYRCLAAIAKRKGAMVLAVGGWRDHVHIYARGALSRTSEIRKLTMAPPLRVGQPKHEPSRCLPWYAPAPLKCFSSFLLTVHHPGSLFTAVRLRV